MLNEAENIYYIKYRQCIIHNYIYVNETFISFLRIHLWL